MKLHSIAMACALAIAALPAIASAHEHAGRTTPTLGDVDAVPASEVVKVSCSNQNWPTPNQVARYARVESTGRADELRRQIRTAGRQACANGFTHVRIEFRAATSDIAVTPVIAPSTLGN